MVDEYNTSGPFLPALWSSIPHGRWIHKRTLFYLRYEVQISMVDEYLNWIIYQYQVQILYDEYR